jgi:hypothetical protein
MTQSNHALETTVITILVHPSSSSHHHHRQAEHHATIGLILLEFPGDRETGTIGKLLVIAREDKTLQGVGLHSRQKVRSQ